MARNFEKKHSSLGREEDDPSSDLLGMEEDFLDSKKLESDPAIRGLLEDGLKEVIKATFHLITKKQLGGRSRGQQGQRKEEGEGTATADTTAKSLETIPETVEKNANGGPEKKGPGSSVSVFAQGSALDFNDRPQRKSSRNRKEKKPFES